VPRRSTSTSYRQEDLKKALKTSRRHSRPQEGTQDLKKALKTS
jgi:hypothetical protein